jgi:hypothetical protein
MRTTYMLPSNERPGVIFMTSIIMKFFTLEDLLLSDLQLYAKYLNHTDREDWPVIVTSRAYVLTVLALRTYIYRRLAHERV